MKVHLLENEKAPVAAHAAVSANTAATMPAARQGLRMWCTKTLQLCSDAGGAGECWPWPLPRVGLALKGESRVLMVSGANPYCLPGLEKWRACATGGTHQLSLAPQPLASPSPPPAACKLQPYPPV